MVTFALAIVAQEGSLTKPEMVPRSDCAKVNSEIVKQTNNIATAARQAFFIVTLLVTIQSFEVRQLGIALDGTTQTVRHHEHSAEIPLIFWFFWATEIRPGLCHKSPEKAIRFFTGIGAEGVLARFGGARAGCGRDRANNNVPLCAARRQASAVVRFPLRSRQPSRKTGVLCCSARSPTGKGHRPFPPDQAGGPLPLGVACTFP